MYAYHVQEVRCKGGVEQGCRGSCDCSGLDQGEGRVFLGTEDAAPAAAIAARTRSTNSARASIFICGLGVAETSRARVRSACRLPCNRPRQ